MKKKDKRQGVEVENKAQSTGHRAQSTEEENRNVLPP